ncbi:MAG: restriction endonuclease [Sulfuricella sp.]
MKIKFDSNQAYQLDAINAVVDAFDGQPLTAGAFEVSLDISDQIAGWTELGIGNRLALDDEATYNPDWAIVKEDDQKVYLVRETKGTKDQFKLRGSEWAKIQCGHAHFDALGVDFCHVVSASEV